MIEPKTLEDLARKLAEAVPESAQALRADIERNFRGVLNGAFQRLDLVTREEYDVQRAVLERTREKLAALEARIATLEQSAGSGG